MARFTPGDPTRARSPLADILEELGHGMAELFPAQVIISSVVAVERLGESATPEEIDALAIEIYSAMEADPKVREALPGLAERGKGRRRSRPSEEV